MTEAASNPPTTSDKPPATAPAGHWTPFDNLRQEIDRLFDDFRPFGWQLPANRGKSAATPPNDPRAAWQVAPAIDVVEKDGAYVISAELPGIDEKDVEIKLANRILTITGEKSEQKEETDKGYFLSERRYGSFQRSFRVPDGVDADKIEADFAKGVLTVRLPKSEQARQAEKRISVKAG